MLASGTAWTADIPNPLAQMASKPASSASLADSASWAPAASTTPDCPKSPSRPSRMRTTAYSDGPRAGASQCLSERDSVLVTSGLRTDDGPDSQCTYRSVRMTRSDGQQAR